MWCEVIDWIPFSVDRIQCCVLVNVRNLRFLPGVSIKISMYGECSWFFVLHTVTSCSIVGGYQYFRRIPYFCLQGCPN
jgi:hypothetical protein